jgi:shikimate kinase
VASRLRHDTKRPLLQVSDPQGAAAQLFADRDPLYRERTIHHRHGPALGPTLVNMVVMQLELAGIVLADPR